MKTKMVHIKITLPKTLLFLFWTVKSSQCKFIYTFLLCSLSPSPWVTSLASSSLSFSSLFPPSSVRWTVSARFVSLFCPRAGGDVGVAWSCFKLSFPEMFEGTSRVLSVALTLDEERGWGVKELELPGQSLSHQWTNDSLFDVRSEYVPHPGIIRFCSGRTQKRTQKKIGSFQTVLTNIHWADQKHQFEMSDIVSNMVLSSDSANWND